MTLFPLQASVENPNVAMGLAVLAGFGFGFTLEKAGFGDARKLVRQFLGTEMLMLKVVFSAVATAVLVTALLDGLGLIQLRALADLVTTPTFLWPMIVGGLLIGAGIVFSGYCPGTSFVGMASGKLDAVVAYGGVILGQLVAAELDRLAPFARFFASGAKGHLYLYEALGVPAAVLALAVALVAIGSFLFGEWVERKLAGADAPASPAREKRIVFGALAGVGLLAVVTLALPLGAKAVPRKLLVPDLVTTVTAAPPVMPCSASKLFVEMLTSSMLSTGMMPACSKSAASVSASPSSPSSIARPSAPQWRAMSAAAVRATMLSRTRS